jgi:branched-chain amino acid aminotransferase
MSAAEAYFNDRFVPATDAVIPVTDAGFVQGTTVAEQLRTFGGRLFRLQQHVDRLFRSLEIVEVAPPMTRQQFIETATELAARNHRLLAPGDDLGLGIFVTPGSYAPMTPEPSTGATVGMHTFPLRFELWAGKYELGEALATTDVAQVPDGCWPSELKCRSRMHYFLADRQARSRFPGSRALMRDEQGFVTETTTANIVLVEGSRLVTPPRHKVLSGISLAALGELTGKLGLPFEQRDLRPEDLLAADEVFMTATSNCMLPVVRLNGEPIGGGKPGPMYRRLLAAWSAEVGLDIAAQAASFSQRTS